MIDDGGISPERAAVPSLLSVGAVQHRLTAARLRSLTSVVVVADAVRASPEAFRTIEAGEGNMDPRDVDLAVDVDRFDFAMEVERIAGRLTIHPRTAF